MSGSFSINLKKSKGKNKKKRQNNIFGDNTSNDINERTDDLMVNTKKRKIKITEIKNDEESINKEGESKLVISLQNNNADEHIQETTSLDEYEAVPVELFGSAILRGMGWDDKDDIAQKSSDLVKSAHSDSVGIGAKGTNDNTNFDSFMPIVKIPKE